ncbi:MAG TPA: hypothetical protein VGZ69_07235 [Candidatus Rhabdochlamydia sp.]|nr:hypothetical protein [Candidatus Rhabdochlamydia sp.]
MIHPVASLSLPLHKQSQSLPSETLGMGKKKKTMHFRKHNQEAVEENLDRDLTIKRKGLKRLREKGLKV